LQDHNSSTPLSSTIGDWIRSGVVVYNMFAGHHLTRPRKVFKNSGQGFAFQDCLLRSRGRHKWLAFVDADEYLVLTGENKNITSLLKEYEQFGGLAVNWRVFGSSRHVARPNLPVLQAYTQSIPDELNSDNIHVKHIVNMRFPARISSTPHTFMYVRGKYAVTEQFRKCGTPFCSPVSVARIAVHHYLLKSEEEFRAKMARGGGSGSTKKMDFFENINRRAHGENFDGVRAYAACCAHLQQSRH
jgi:glycosyltransferase involved in cell wall biosynthesis